MAKGYYHRKRTSYTKKVMNKSAPTVKRPYGGRNNDDCFVKFELVRPLMASEGFRAFHNFRFTSGDPGQPQFNTNLKQSPEFEYQKQLWAFYEVKGIKATTSLYPESYTAIADQYAGPFPNIPSGG